jgi:hypothetical protein
MSTGSLEKEVHEHEDSRDSFDGGHGTSECGELHHHVPASRPSVIETSQHHVIECT